MKLRRRRRKSCRAEGRALRGIRRRVFGRGVGVGELAATGGGGQPPVSEGAAPTKEDFATVAVWAACGVLLAFKLLINPA